MCAQGGGEQLRRGRKDYGESCFGESLEAVVLPEANTYAFIDFLLSLSIEKGVGHREITGIIVLYEINSYHLFRLMLSTVCCYPVYKTNATPKTPDSMPFQYHAMLCKPN